MVVRITPQEYFENLKKKQPSLQQTNLKQILPTPLQQVTPIYNIKAILQEEEKQTWKYILMVVGGFIAVGLLVALLYHYSKKSE